MQVVCPHTRLGSQQAAGKLTEGIKGPLYCMTMRMCQDLIWDKASSRSGKPRQSGAEYQRGDGPGQPCYWDGIIQSDSITATTWTRLLMLFLKSLGLIDFHSGMNARRLNYIPFGKVGFAPTIFLSGRWLGLLSNHDRYKRPDMYRSQIRLG